MYNYIQDLLNANSKLSALNWVTTDYYRERCNCYDKDKDKLVFTTELPGFEKEEVAVSYRDGKLIIRAEAKDKKATYAKRGFSEIWKITGEVDESNITARLDKGILTVTVPMIVKESKSIDITVT